MKSLRSSFAFWLVLEAVVLLVLTWVSGGEGGGSSGVLAAPFAQLGYGLRLLSLSGAAGNALAIVLYVLLCLVPAGALLVLRRKRPLAGEDSLLVLLTVVLFPVLYCMVNPGVLPAPWGTLGTGCLELLGGAVYAILLAYAVLRLLRRFLAADGPALRRYGRLLWRVLAVIFVYLAFGSCFRELLSGWDQVLAGNQGNESVLTATGLLLVLRWLGAALPYLLAAWVALTAWDLTAALETGETQQILPTAERLSRRCAGSLAATVVVTVVLDLLQLWFLRVLYAVHISVYLPVLPLALVLGVLLLVQVIRENRRLQDDNDLFI